MTLTTDERATLLAALYELRMARADDDEIVARVMALVDKLVRRTRTTRTSDGQP